MLRVYIPAFSDQDKPWPLDTKVTTSMNEKPNMNEREPKTILFWFLRSGSEQFQPFRSERWVNENFIK